ncbi:hypothetical protein CCACVL1_27455 [Corchorus capsularis]|uniref:Uncharacterized protein n=1 Tax=Corchorus capsularis TaxID=210143 RepID=A0A1R3GA28_COCAP|nr:hypothetical protein CCACVL1_27455 [Corchorus capsularis]
MVKKSRMCSVKKISRDARGAGRISQLPRRLGHHVGRPGTIGIQHQRCLVGCPCWHSCCTFMPINPPNFLKTANPKPTLVISFTDKLSTKPDANNNKAN